jgi:CheY-like chemotaxis protein
MKIHLLVAEDNPDIRLVVRLCLKREGFEITVANNGVEALARIAERPPDAVLLDWMMPEMNGLEACARLKADPATRDIPVIFLTAKSQVAEIQQGLAFGAIGFITKPFDALTLGATVRGLLKA